MTTELQAAAEELGTVQDALLALQKAALEAVSKIGKPEFVQIMQQLESLASTSSNSTKAEKREDEAHGNTACDEAGDAAEALEHALYITAGVFAKDRKKAALWLLMNLQETGFSIVRTSTLSNRNGVYNTRTDKDVD